MPNYDASLLIPSLFETEEEWVVIANVLQLTGSPGGPGGPCTVIYLASPSVVRPGGPGGPIMPIPTGPRSPFSPFDWTEEQKGLVSQKRSHQGFRLSFRSFPREKSFVKANCEAEWKQLRNWGSKLFRVEKRKDQTTYPWVAHFAFETRIPRRTRPTGNPLKLIINHV